MQQEFASIICTIVGDYGSHMRNVCKVSAVMRTLFDTILLVLLENYSC